LDTYQKEYFYLVKYGQNNFKINVDKKLKYKNGQLDKKLALFYFRQMVAKWHQSGRGSTDPWSVQH
jgi:hypothetical protein